MDRMFPTTSALIPVLSALGRKLEYKKGLICKYETAGQVLARMRMLISGHSGADVCVGATDLTGGRSAWHQLFTGNKMT